MKRWIWGLLPLAIMVALVVVFATRFGHDPRYIPSPLIGKPAPQFSLERLYAPQRRVSNATFANKVVLFNVFASWCVACTDESKALDYLKRHHVVIYGLDYDDTRPRAKDWLNRWGNPYQQVAFDHAGIAAADWGIWGVPETFVIDRHGQVVHKFTGVISMSIAKTEVLPMVRQLEKHP